MNWGKNESLCIVEFIFFQDLIRFFHGDIGEQATLDTFLNQLGTPIDALINNACISRNGILSHADWADFEAVQRVGVTAPYYLVSQLYQRTQLVKGASIVNIASTRANQSQADTECYAAVKGGILSLTHALAVSLSGHARVNAISPGWIDVSPAEAPYPFEPADLTQHPARRVGTPDDIAHMVLFLCDAQKSGFITGENIVIDGGMSRLMVYHNDKGWHYQPPSEA